MSQKFIGLNSISNMPPITLHNPLSVNNNSNIYDIRIGNADEN